MPLYDLQCQNEKCNRTFEIFCCIADLQSYIMKQKCPHCGSKVKQVLSKFGMGWFKPHVNWDFDGTPIQVESKQHLKQLCKKYGVQSRALL